MPFLKKHLIQISLSLLVMFFLIGYVAQLFHSSAINQFDLKLYDARLRLAMPNTQDNQVVIVDIDEKSLAEIGHWPWSRNQLALLLDNLFDKYHVPVVGFDIVFAEKDESSGLKVLETLSRKELKHNADYQATLKQLHPTLDYDQLFASHMKGRKVVLGYYFNEDNNRVSGKLPPPALTSATLGNKQGQFSSATGYGANLSIFQDNAAGGGHFNPYPDEDGVSRRVPMLYEYNQGYYIPLSLAIIQAYLDIERIEPVFPDEGNGYAQMEWIKAGPFQIPVDENISAIIPYRGQQGSFNYISATDVINAKAPLAALQGKIVLVGTTAPGLKDLRVTPVAGVYPGVEIHANLVAGILDHRIPQKPAYLLGAEVLFIFLVGVLLTYVLLAYEPLKATLITATIATLTLAGNYVLWKQEQIAFPLASSVLLITLLYAINMTYGYFFEARRKHQLSSLFGQYVPPELVNKMSDDPEKYTMEGQSKELTILFSDVRGFTTISEGMDPKELTKLMNEFLTALSQVIREKYLGTIDKYMGDCIMAFWGAPFENQDHAHYALLAGIEMQQVMHRLSATFQEKGWPAIKIGVGINTGKVTVGDMGSKFRKAYTVMGDAVNLASRLEGVTKQYGVDIIVGETTASTIGNFVFKELDNIKVKGKDKPVAIFEPIGGTSQVSQAQMKELGLFSESLKLYRAQNWDRAELQLLNLQKEHPDTFVYTLYLNRIQHFRNNPPPPDWDGVYEFDTK